MTLRSLPNGLYETYDRILLKIAAKGDAVATRTEKILMWLVGATRPLLLEELEEAVMIEPGNSELNASLRFIDTTDIITICGSLVEAFSDQYNRHRRYVQLSHYTVWVNLDHCLI